ncbi:MAG: BREX-2 system adenine-specific DNA-methyltransferase PglX, partial [bacterium]
MIDQARLTEDLRKLLDKELLPALRKRAEREKALDAALREEHSAAKAARRTGQAFEMWREDTLTQVGVAWVLGCVFVRFMEDNGLVDAKDHFPRIAGSGPSKKYAEDQRTAYFSRNREASDRDYLLWAFTDLAALPACKELFSKDHNPLWAQGGKLMDADAATRVIEFFQQVDGKAEGKLLYDFTDASLSTRFLGDLYQNLSEAARKKYALLQTPIFVEEFILDRTLEPAIKEFGLCDQKGRELSAQHKPIPSDHLLRLIDPTVGSGHFLLGAFERLFAHWQKQEPMTEPAVLAERCLNSLFGVDLNPYAANIARFRLLVAALKACGIKRLREARDWTINIAVGDSLLHGSFAGGAAGGELFEAQVRTDTGNQYATSAEDLEVLRRLLMPRRYHVVVGNPPYITVKDAALSEAYRRRYGSCHRKYALSVPFFERFFDLAVAPEGTEVSKAGFVGKITANSFMKREFGKKLIETYLPRWDLTHVIDTSGAYIPGHGTPTVILFGRHRAPVAKTIRAVLGIRGEPSTPEDPATAKVWSAILGQIDRPGSESEFVSVSDAPRENFHAHPWSIGGGGAAELKETMDESCDRTLDDLAESIGPASFPGVDDPFVAPRGYFERHRFPAACLGPFVTGEEIRDWSWIERDWSFAPYGSSGAAMPLDPKAAWACSLWRHRTLLRNVTSFGGKTREDLGESWWTWYRWIWTRVSLGLKIAFPSVATHNHIVLLNRGVYSNRHAPFMVLDDAREYVALSGLLNSVAACFWMKQVFHNKGSSIDQHGARQRTMPFEDFWEHDGTKIKQFPVPWDKEGTANPLRTAVMGVARDIDTLAQARAQLLPTSLLAATPSPHSALLQAARTIVQLSRTTVQTSRTTLQPDRTTLQTDGTTVQPTGTTLQPDGTILQLARTTLQTGRREANAHHSPESPRAGGQNPAPGAPPAVLSRADLDAAKEAAQSILQQMIALQEELDWLVYRAYGLLEDTKAEHQPAADAPPINLGERAFEIVMARKMEAGTLQTEWFRRHGSTSITAIPAHWPAAYKKVVEHRIALIEAGAKQNKDIALIE